MLTRRGLNAFAKLVATVFAFDDPGTRGLLQGIDARAKVIGLIGLVVVVTFVHNFAALGLAYFACIVLAAASRIPLRRFAGVWLVVPLFSLAIMLPATLNIVTPGKPLWIVRGNIAVTDAGLLFAGMFVLRTALCVSLALLLASTTRPVKLFRGLRMLGMPKVFVSMLTMMERYLSVTAKAAQEIHMAKISRTIASGGLRKEHAWVASGIGSLYRRTHALGHEVHLAMISRGYTGDIRIMDDPRLHFRDWIFLVAAAAFGFILIRL